MKAIKIEMIGRLIKNVIQNLRNSVSTPSRQIHYRISSVNQDKQTIVLHIIQKSVFIKLTFSEIISNMHVIESLSSQSACWIGVYYGVAMRKAVDGKGSLRSIKKPSYLLNHEYGCYRIVAENRDGTVDCIHIKTGKQLNIDPDQIAKDDEFIKQFDASQACYIGILTGIKMGKKRDPSLLENQKKIPYLRIVK